MKLILPLRPIATMRVLGVLTRKCINFSYKTAYKKLSMTQNAKVNTLFVNTPQMKLVLSRFIFCVLNCIKNFQRKLHSQIVNKQLISKIWRTFCNHINLNYFTIHI